MEKQENKKNPFSLKYYNLTEQNRLYKELKEKIEEICYLKTEAAIEEIWKQLTELM